MNLRFLLFSPRAPGALAFLLFAAMLQTGVRAEDAAPKPPPSNRYLFVVDTSRSMSGRAEAVQKAVAELLVSGMNGQLRPGDTFGVWTFNEELYAGQFPLQRWSAETARKSTAATLIFLQGQKFEKQARLEKVLPALQRVIKESEFLTVILITDGSGKIEGTPFDESINAFFREWRREQAKAQMPVLVALRANRGALTHHTVAAAPWPLELPPLPAELLAAHAPKPKPPAPPAPPPPAIGEPLILSGKKAEPVADTPAETTAEPVERPASIPTSPDPSPVQPVIAPEPLRLAPEAPTGAEPAPAQGEPIVAPTVAIPGASVETPAALTDSPRAGDTPKPAAPAVPEEPSAPASDSESTPLLAPVQPAVTSPSESLFSRKSVWIGLSAVVVVVLALMLVLYRRSHSSAHASLITRSLDRDKQ